MSFIPAETGGSLLVQGQLGLQVPSSTTEWDPVSKTKQNKNRQTKTDK